LANLLPAWGLEAGNAANIVRIIKENGVEAPTKLSTKETEKSTTEAAKKGKRQEKTPSKHVKCEASSSPATKDTM
jgi:hypothetical protein